MDKPATAPTPPSASTSPTTGDPAGQTAGEVAAAIEAYLQAVAERDLARCMDLYAEDATLVFVNNRFQGRPAIEQWHKDRFANEFAVVKVHAIRPAGETAVLDATITSKRLRAWRIDTLSGRATLQFQGGKIKEIKMGLRPHNPFEGW
jgi:uncharacterized protein (TIGR02246 family)